MPKAQQGRKQEFHFPASQHQDSTTVDTELLPEDKVNYQIRLEIIKKLFMFITVG